MHTFVQRKTLIERFLDERFKLIFLKRHLFGLWRNFKEMSLNFRHHWDFYLSDHFVLDHWGSCCCCVRVRLQFVYFFKVHSCRVVLHERSVGKWGSFCEWGFLIREIGRVLFEEVAEMLFLSGFWVKQCFVRVWEICELQRLMFSVTKSRYFYLSFWCN